MNIHSYLLSRSIRILLFFAILEGSFHVQAAGLAPEHEPLAGDQNLPLATFVVNSTVDAVDAVPGNGVCATAGSVCTLRAAVQEANALAGADTITLPAGTYTLTLPGSGENAAAFGDLDLTSNITLNGAGAATTIIDGNSIDRVFHVTGVFTVNISGVTMSNGNGAGGGVRNDGGVLTIVNSAFTDNYSTGLATGGAIFNSGTLAITNGAFSSNSSGNDGGAIFNSGTLTITNGAFSSNSSGNNGGAIFNSSTLTITNGAFSDNSSGNDGGAIFTADALTITGSAFSGNSSGGNGGAIFTVDTLTITSSAFSGNSSGGDGGAIFAPGTLTVTSCTFSDNSASNDGGAIKAGGGAMITRSTFSDNSAWLGGGIYTLSTVTIANSTFSNNNASDGDDSYTNGGALSIVNSTLFGYYSEHEDIDTTSSGPSSVNSGSGVFNATGSVTLTNTIIAGHDSDENCAGVITNGGNNLEDGATCGWGSANGSMSNTDPMLLALTGNPAYFPLNLSSPAIDAGKNVACAAAPVSNTSQNGATRPIDGDGNGTATCDIGAFEDLGLRVYLPLISYVNY